MLRSSKPHPLPPFNTTDDCFSDWFIKFSYILDDQLVKMFKHFTGFRSITIHIAITWDEKRDSLHCDVYVSLFVSKCKWLKNRPWWLQSKFMEWLTDTWEWRNKDATFWSPLSLWPLVTSARSHLYNIRDTRPSDDTYRRNYDHD